MASTISRGDAAQILLSMGFRVGDDTVARCQRAFSDILEMDAILNRDGDDFVVRATQSASLDVYRVRANLVRPGCNCPDARFAAKRRIPRRPCKHVMACLLLLAAAGELAVELPTEVLDAFI